MFWCVPCLNPKGPWEDIIVNMKGVVSHRHRPTQVTGSSSDSASAAIDEMVEGTRRLKMKRKKKKQEMAMSNGGQCHQQHHVDVGHGGVLEEAEKGGEEPKEKEKAEEYWVGEVDLGVLITFVSLPSGGNRIERIRLRKDMFDASEALKWWSNNYEKILDLYCVKGISTSPLQSDDEIPSIKIPGTSSQESSHTQSTGNSDHNSAASSSSLPAHHNASTGGGHERQMVFPGKLVEWVVEDQPGVFITVRSRSDGSKELQRVELSREKFGEVKARVWWEENKGRVEQQYT